MKILLMGPNNLSSLNEKDFLFHLNNAYNFFCSTDANITLEIWDFNIKPENEKVNAVCEMNKFEYLI